MDKQHKQTDKRLAVMEKHLTQVYSRASNDVGKNWKEYIDKQGEKILKLHNDYLEAIKSGDKDKIAKAKQLLQEKEKAVTLRDKRYQRQTEKLAEELLHVNETAIAYVNHQLPEIYSLNYNGLAEKVDGIGGYSFELTDPTTVRNLATRNNNLLPYKEVDGRKDIRWNTKKINSEVLQGILLGEPMDKIAKRFSNVLDMNKTSAIRNARTSVTSAENKGRQDSYIQAEKDGIQLEKEWLSSDQAGRTRDWHMPSAFEKLKVPIDKPFVNDFGEIMYPADPHAHPANVYNCRCTMGAEYVGFNKKRVEEVMAEREIAHTEDYNKFIDIMNKNEVEYRNVEKLKRELSQQEIIDKIGGGDKTGGSCASLAYAYIGNKGGYNLFDFRGGISRECFADRQYTECIKGFTGVKTITKSVKKELSDGYKFLQSDEIKKNVEYKLSIGKHTAIIRKNDDILEYLELQTENNNGWHELTYDALEKRFGARKTADRFKGKVFEKQITLTEVDSLKNNKEFIDIAGYFNTASDMQKKGAKGYAK